MRHYNSANRLQQRLKEIVQRLESVKDTEAFELTPAEVMLVENAVESMQALRTLVRVAPYRRTTTDKG